jgi:signal transduction histidine kinase
VSATTNDDDLIATMSHELRAPLNAILGWVQLLRAGAVCGAETDRALEIIERNARLQAKAVDETLDLVRISQGQVRIPEGGATRWAEGLRAAIAGNLSAASAREVKISADVDPALRVAGEYGRLTQVARGIIASAIRRSVHGGTVRVRLYREGSRGVLAVTEDRGASEPSDERLADERLIARVRRRVLLGDGRGLGVALARALARLHGGTLEEADDGATVVVRIPIAQRPADDHDEDREGDEEKVVTAAP